MPYCSQVQAVRNSLFPCRLTGNDSNGEMPWSKRFFSGILVQGLLTAPGPELPPSGVPFYQSPHPSYELTVFASASCREASGTSRPGSGLLPPNPPPSLKHLTPQTLLQPRFLAETRFPPFLSWGRPGCRGGARKRLQLSKL